MSPSPGRTLNSVYTSFGRILEKKANRAAHSLGLGPHVVAQKIKGHFGNGEDRVQHLELLRTSVPQKLEKRCFKLLKYTFPTESPNMQHRAFKYIVELITLFPGLRVLFLHAKCILNLPAFWLDMGSVHCNVAKKLCCEMIKVLKDIGVDVLALGPIDRQGAPIDCDGVDLLAVIILTGVSIWLSKLDQKDWALQTWPQAAELLPNSSAYATSAFENVLPIVCQNAELNIMVNRKDKFPDTQDTIDGDHLADLNCKDDSTSDVHCDGSQQDDPRTLNSIREDSNDAQSQDWDTQSQQQSQSEAMSPSTFGNEECEVMSKIADPMAMGIGSTQMDDIAPDFSVKLDFQPELDTNYNPTAYIDDSNLGNAAMGRIGKQAEERKSILLQRKRDLGDDHPDTLEAMENLAWAYHELRDDNPHTLCSMGNLALTYSQLGQFEAAAKLYVIGLEKQRGLLGEDHPATVWIMDNLASTYRELGQSKKAEELQVIVLEKQRNLLGEDHPDILRIMGNLAGTYHQLGQFKKAEELQIVVVEKQKKLLGEDHRHTLHTMNNLASTYHELGQFKKAEELGAVALEKQSRLLGEDHPDTIRTMGNLALTYHQLGQFKKAEVLDTEMLKKRREWLGEDHPRTLQTRVHLASTYRQLGQYKKAEELEVGALEKQMELLGEDHPDTLYTMGNLASTYHMQGQLKHAEDIFVDVVAKWRQVLGDNHPSTRWAMHSLALTYHSLGKLQDAEELERLLGDQEV
ncbi:hypothetical protein MVEN_01608500 [Mycena venus]|uniref:Kinesin light chain n=1 Tax=Mycena venus TaxID=2733690 RepID=A0A8H7CRU9_9AGAR|nr:hypothetical protein MVEN_01608500 [Mycena venus]